MNLFSRSSIVTLVISPLVSVLRATKLRTVAEAAEPEGENGGETMTR